MGTQSKQPEILWLDNNIPLSSRFDDTYYTRADGRAEAEYVFINANNLHARWEQLDHCAIGELGFGTGLNFVETVWQWQNLKTNKMQLHFNSFEQYPLSKDEIHRALSQWPELNDLTTKLCDIWQNDTDFITIDFFPHIKLTIHFGDVNETLPNTKLAIDAWYLDGFSPAKNPQMWNMDMMRQVYDKTNTNGTFATYTVAGYVRRNLQQAGFKLSRKEGFGSKREMLFGIKP